MSPIGMSLSINVVVLNFTWTITKFLCFYWLLGTGNENSQKEINDEWAKKFDGILQSPKSSYEKWKEIDEIGKKYFKDGNKAIYFFV